MNASKPTILLLASLMIPVVAPAQERAASKPKEIIVGSAARFSITLDGYEIASFSELQGITTEVEPVELTFKRGKSNSRALWSWHEAVLNGDMAAARKSASLVTYDVGGKAVARYRLENAWPSKVDLGSWSKADGLQVDWGKPVPMETITIVVERIERVSP